MVHYSFREDSAVNSCKAKGNNWLVHFKNTYETANVIRKMPLKRAYAYLKNVIAHKECVPFTRYKGGVGKCAQAKQFRTVQGRWPQKSAKFLIDLLKNAESNAEYNGLDVDRLVVRHLQVSRGCVSRRRRAFRAHGRINTHRYVPCNIQVYLTEEEYLPSIRKRTKRSIK
ncbi:hypothetical protein PPYR_11612 [Photinus pyralis]|uniref:Large ribosomal subunit protein uL22 n=1 Tax=Photinus pyralis TaxID=7054 RepID=A0A5N4ABS4_PHOPY|nr:60S ribosomal protein L17-like [Photinus pyralis]XP_031351043.1 60S ribosomal protein L17-like [Photinus pyralis]KAB0794773.1 hypothetical protein PPYR_11612 [Photinus pyralis]